MTPYTLSHKELLDLYENAGFIPTAKGANQEEGGLINHTCPWCGETFIVYGVHNVHCPYCCMEMKLDWEVECGK